MDQSEKRTTLLANYTWLGVKVEDNNFAFFFSEKLKSMVFVWTLEPLIWRKKKHKYLLCVRERKIVQKLQSHDKLVGFRWSQGGWPFLQPFPWARAKGSIVLRRKVKTEDRGAGHDRINMYHSLLLLTRSIRFWFDNFWPSFKL